MISGSGNKQTGRFVRWTAVVLALTVLGCGRSGVPEIGTVEGTVTLDGKPLPGAIVMFQPQGKGRASFGQTDEQGEYYLVYVDDVEGALPGKHTVTISTYPEKVPARYNKKTELVRDVVVGSNTFDFPLKSSEK
jgi:hypothetical protein